MKTLKCGGCDKLIQVDDEDFDFLKNVNWSCQGVHRIVGTTKEHTRIILHVYLLGYAPTGFEWDHKDRDIHNNQRNNLRVATHRQNSANQGLRKSNTTGVKGVSLERGWYIVQRRVNGRKTRLGKFLTIEQAKNAYDASIKLEYGEFACSNSDICPPSTTL